MKPKNILVIYKKSAFESYFGSYRSASIKKLRTVGDTVLKKIEASHRTHYLAVVSIRKILKKLGMNFESISRGKPFDDSKYDLIVTVGGDGTFLTGAASIRNTPVLAINSDSSHSVGRFCGADAKDFEKIFKLWLQNKTSYKKLSRLSFSLNGGKPMLAANDLLIAHKSPAAMSHYLLKVGARAEKQRSSGLWIATAAGSSGAIGSAGGVKISDIESKKIQYRPRELYSWKNVRYALKGGVVSPGTTVTVLSQMQDGRVYVDGTHFRFPFYYGSKLQIRVSPKPLLLVAPLLDKRH